VALVGGALAVVGYLTIQAGRQVPNLTAASSTIEPTATAPSTSAGAAGSALPSGSVQEAPSNPPVTVSPSALPSDSGTGKRIVYSLSANRVWIVAASGDVLRTFSAVPPTVLPKVTQPPLHLTRGSRYSNWTAPDKTPIQDVVFFGPSGHLNQFAFEGVVGVTGTPPAPAAGAKTGGIRLSATDALAVWEATDPTGATKITDVVVVP
jgi:hypothetical protein